VQIQRKIKITGETVFCAYKVAIIKLLIISLTINNRQKKAP